MAIRTDSGVRGDGRPPPGGTAAPMPGNPQSPQKRKPRQPSTGTARWVLACAVAAAVIGASLGLSNVVASNGWLPRGFLVVIFTAFPPALLRRFPKLRPFAPIAALLGWIMGLSLTFFPTTSYLGLIPSLDSFKSAASLASDAGATILVSNTPVPVDESISFVICLGLGFVALMVDTLAITFAAPAWSGLPLVLLLVPAALTALKSVGTPGFIGAIIGYLLILGCCHWYAPNGQLRGASNRAPTGTLARAAALGAGVVLLVAVLPNAIPGFNSGSFPQGSRLGVGGVSGLDPMISLGNDLRSQSSSISLTYATTSKQALYLRTSTLEDFSGKTWKPSPVPAGLSNGLAELNTGLFGQNLVPMQPRITTFLHTSNVDIPWLPAPTDAIGVRNLAGTWTFNPSTATFHAAAGTSTRGQNYEVTSEVPDLMAPLLETATAPPRGDLDSMFLRLPGDVPAIVRETEAKVVAGAQTPYAKAMAIQDYLRSPQFSYSTSTPVQKGYDGSGMGVLAKFLESKSGYCVHFSAAMAVMAREAGIPSRIAVGYAPGAATSGDGEQSFVDEDSGQPQQLSSFQATGLDAHSWPELYFEGIGWVPFEPTPSRGVVPAYAQDASTSPGPTQAASDALNGANKNPTANSTATASPKPSAAASASAAATTSPSGGKSILWLPLWIVAALALLSVPALWRIVQRRRRLAALTDSPTHQGSARVSAEETAWQDLWASATDFGYRRDASDTPAAQGRAISALVSGKTDAANDADVARILDAYQWRIYGPGSDGPPTAQPHIDLAHSLQRIRTRLSARATPWQRLCATVAPASLFTSKR